MAYTPNTYNIPSGTLNTTFTLSDDYCAVRYIDEYSQYQSWGTVSLYDGAGVSVFEGLSPTIINGIPYFIFLRELLGVGYKIVFKEDRATTSLGAQMQENIISVTSFINTVTLLGKDIGVMPNDIVLYKKIIKVLDPYLIHIVSSPSAPGTYFIQLLLTVIHGGGTLPFTMDMPNADTFGEFITDWEGQHPGCFVILSNDLINGKGLFDGITYTDITVKSGFNIGAGVEFTWNANEVEDIGYNRLYKWSEVSENTEIHNAITQGDLDSIQEISRRYYISKEKSINTVISTSDVYEYVLNLTDAIRFVDDRGGSIYSLGFKILDAADNVLLDNGSGGYLNIRNVAIGGEANNNNTSSEAQLGSGWDEGNTSVLSERIDITFNGTWDKIEVKQPGIDPNTELEYIPQIINVPVTLITYQNRDFYVFEVELEACSNVGNFIIPAAITDILTSNLSFSFLINMLLEGEPYNFTKYIQAEEYGNITKQLSELEKIKYIFFGNMMYRLIKDDILMGNTSWSYLNDKFNIDCIDRYAWCKDVKLRDRLSIEFKNTIEWNN